MTIWLLILSRLLLTLLLSTQVHTFETTGATGGIDPETGARPFRYEINTFSQSGPAWHLFILALYQIQTFSQSDPQSYFGIAGIHGFPVRPYDDVSGTGTYPGFCMHASIPFTTWHRPYLALYEQIIWTRAQAIAEMYPAQVRDQYTAAAQTVRIPYWDSAANPRLPDAVTTPSIQLVTPRGNQTIANPLYSYNFQSDAAGNGFAPSHPMANFTKTVRWSSNTKPDGDQSAATAALTANGPSILQQTYQLFANPGNFSTFSCTTPGGQHSANNVEAIHNTIHDLVGGWGHMQFPEVAAFDPIFWLHHANVDRWLALWQVLNPDSWLIPTANTYGSYYEPVGTMDSGSSALAPFHSDSGTTMFTSDDVRSTARFGYAYPEIAEWTFADTTQLQNSVRQQINRLYNPSMNPSPKRSLISQPLRRAANFATDFAAINVEETKMYGVNNADRQWFVKIAIDRFAYSTTFALHFFMGDPPLDPASWPAAPNLVGTQGQFINADTAAMHPEGTPPGVIESELAITHVLVGGMRKGFLLDLGPDNVIPVLQQGLQWRARAADGSEIDCSQLSDLLISVGSRQVEPATDESCFPKYEDVEWHGEVTQGKVGGGRQFYRLSH